MKISLSIIVVITMLIFSAGTLSAQLWKLDKVGIPYLKPSEEIILKNYAKIIHSIIGIIHLSNETRESSFYHRNSSVRIVHKSKYLNNETNID